VADSYFIHEDLKQKILEIQKKNKLKKRIDNFSRSVGVSVEMVMDTQKEFNEILKELGYEQ